MTVSFKQFSDFLSASEGVQAPEKLDEIWDKILGKKKEDADTKDAKKGELTAQEKKAKGMVLTAKDRIELMASDAEKRKKELQKKRDQAFIDAKERAETHGKTGSTSMAKYNRDDYALQRQMKEGKESYSEHGYWKDDCAECGYKVKKLSGEMMKGDQTWGAFDGDRKVGEFTEKEDGRGGWLIKEALQEAKTHSFFQMSDASKVEKMDLEAAKAYLKGKIDASATKADPENVKKAHAMVNAATSSKKLVFGVSNFILAAEKQRVIR